jgi:hypothetical protein
MGIVHKTKGQSIFGAVSTESFSSASCSIASGTVEVNGTARVNVAHGLGVIPKVVSVFATTGSFVPIVYSIDATNLNITASGSCTVGYSAF